MSRQPPADVSARRPNSPRVSDAGNESDTMNAANETAVSASAGESTVPSSQAPNFSPKPWRANKGDLTIRAINDDLVHVHAFSERNEHDAANVQLMATAPDLLEACQAVLAAVESQAKDTIWILPPYQAAAVHESVVDRLQDVIEKATEGEPVRTIDTKSELEEIRPVVAYEVWVRLKKSSKYYHQGLQDPSDDKSKAMFFKLDAFEPQRGMALMSDCHLLKFHSNSYRREDCEFFLVDPKDTKRFLRIL